MDRVLLSPKDARRVKRLLAQSRPCLLCGAPPAYAAIFVPDHPEVWGCPPGKRRLLGYALCAPCHAFPDRELRVEAAIMRGLVGAQN